MVKKLSQHLPVKNRSEVEEGGISIDGRFGKGRLVIDAISALEMYVDAESRCLMF